MAILDDASTVLICRCLAVLAFIYCCILTAFRHSTGEEISSFDSLKEIVIHFMVMQNALTHTHEDSFGLCIACGAVAMWYIFSSYDRYVRGLKYATVDLSGKVYIVTGSNTGIGFQTAKALAKMSATVILACRSREKAISAKNQIVQETNCAPSKIVALDLDLCDFDSVRQFVKDFEALGFPLHCLINNAGLMMNERSVTKAGLEMNITANHLSHFLLTNLLLKFLENTKGRVVVLSSALHRMAKSYDFDDMMAEKNYSLFGTYAQSKLANILFAFELQKRMEAKKTGVTCNVVHPGCVRTEVTRNMNAFMRIGDQIAAPFMKLIQKTPEQGAYCSVHVATAKELEGIGGKYYFNCDEGILGPAAKLGTESERLWKESEKLVGLKK